jgi:predicted butyrate kinase (DUF1464 family)
MTKKSTPVLLETDFELDDDENELGFADNEPSVIVKSRAKDKSKKKKKHVGPSQVVGVRVPNEMVDAINNARLDMAELFRAFIEKEVLHSKTCPTCNQKLLIPVGKIKK